MENSRKNLKITAILLLVLAGFTLINLIGELAFGEINQAQIPEGAPDNILRITKIILMVFSFILLIPQIYLGLKGLKIAKNPDSSKFHIICAIVVFVLIFIEMVSYVINIFKQGEVRENLSAALSILVEVTVYFEYIVYAKAVSEGK